MDYYLIAASIYGLGLIAAIFYYILQIDQPGSPITSNHPALTLYMAIFAISLVWPLVVFYRLRAHARRAFGAK